MTVLVLEILRIIIQSYVCLFLSQSHTDQGVTNRSWVKHRVPRSSSSIKSRDLLFSKLKENMRNKLFKTFDDDIPLCYSYCWKAQDRCTHFLWVIAWWIEILFHPNDKPCRTLYIYILDSLDFIFNCERSSSTIYQINLCVCLFVCHNLEIFLIKGSPANQSTVWD